MRNPHQSKSTNKEDPESFSSSDNLRKTDSRIDDTKITWGITLISATVTKVSSSRSSHYLTLPQQSECLFAYQLMLSQLYPIFAAQKEKFSVSSHKISQTWNCGVIGKNVTGCRISGVSLPRQPRPPSNSARFTPEGDPEPGYSVFIIPQPHLTQRFGRLKFSVLSIDDQSVDVDQHVLRGQTRDDPLGRSGQSRTRFGRREGSSHQEP